MWCHWTDTNAAKWNSAISQVIICTFPIVTCEIVILTINLREHEWMFLDKQMMNQAVIVKHGH